MTTLVNVRTLNFHGHNNTLVQIDKVPFVGHAVDILNEVVYFRNPLEVIRGSKKEKETTRERGP